VATAWYVERAGEQPVGPLSAAQLKRLADEGKLKPTDRVRRDEGAWVAASSVKGLFTPAASQPAPPPEPLPPEPDAAPEPKKPKGLWDQLGDAVKDAAGQVQKAAEAARARTAKPAAEPEADEETPPRKAKKRSDDEAAEPPRERPAKPKLPPKQVLILGAVGGGCLLLLMVGAVVALVVAGAGTSTDSDSSPSGGGSRGGGSQEMTRQQFRDKLKSVPSLTGQKWDGRNRSVGDGAGTPLLTSAVESAVGKPAATRTVGNLIVWTWLCKDGVVSVEANQEMGAVPLIKPDGTRYQQGEILWVLAVNDQ
jgi:hypothetical protein